MMNQIAPAPTKTFFSIWWSKTTIKNELHSRLPYFFVSSTSIIRKKKKQNRFNWDLSVVEEANRCIYLERCCSLVACSDRRSAMDVHRWSITCYLICGNVVQSSDSNRSRTHRRNFRSENNVTRRHQVFDFHRHVDRASSCSCEPTPKETGVESICRWLWSRSRRDSDSGTNGIDWGRIENDWVKNNEQHHVDPCRSRDNSVDSTHGSFSYCCSSWRAFELLRCRPTDTCRSRTTASAGLDACLLPSATRRRRSIGNRLFVWDARRNNVSSVHWDSIVLQHMLTRENDVLPSISARNNGLVLHQDRHTQTE